MKNKFKFKINLSILMLISVFFSVSGKASAAELFFELEEINTTINSVEKVQVFLSTEKNEGINAVDINIEYPVKLLKLKEWSNGNSIVSFWIKEPKNNNGIFSFQGIIPGGYNEKKGLLMVLYFESLKEGDAEIMIKNDSLVLLNDGKGTEAKIGISNLEFRILKGEDQTPSSKFQALPDTDAPEPFEPIVVSDPTMFDGKYFLVFATQDKKSGIDHYEISEGNGPFVIAESPYLLRNQNPKEEIAVKAIDRSGNERIAALSVRKPRTSRQNYADFFATALIIIFLIYLIWKILWRKKIKSNKQ